MNAINLPKNQKHNFPKLSIHLRRKCFKPIEKTTTEVVNKTFLAIGFRMSLDLVHDIYLTNLEQFLFFLSLFTTVCTV